MERFYQEKLEAIINNQTCLYEYDTLVSSSDLNQLLDIVELIMGVVVNCEDKQVHIEKILELDSQSQEDLQKMIERSLERVQIDFGSQSNAGASEAPSQFVAMQKSVEALERDKMHLLEKLQEYEHSNQHLTQANTQMEATLRQLENTVEQLQHEKTLKSETQHLLDPEGHLGGLRGLSELEAELRFKEKEL